MTNQNTKVAIIGASGYAGGELLRILLCMDGIEVTTATSRAHAGKAVSLTHPNLRGLTDLMYTTPDSIEPVDVLFLAMPHGVAMNDIEHYKTLAPKIIDVASDFRLRNKDDYPRVYGGEHTAPEMLDQFVYGLAELHRDEIKNANFVAAGGCEASCSILSLYPLFQAGVVKDSTVTIDAKIGASAAGNKVSDASHYPERAGGVRSYKPTGHRHGAEIIQELGATNVYMQATALPTVRGIVTTASLFLNKDLDEREIRKIYAAAYENEPFMRIVKERQGIYRYPEPKILAGTNFCDVGFELEESTGRLVVIGSLDNLVKGTAGQAIQAMNIMLGRPETDGLTFPGLHPTD